jgi:hypothetical protein
LDAALLVGIIGVVVAAFGIIGSIGIFFVQRERRDLGISVLADADFPRGLGPISHRVGITFDNATVDRLRLTTVLVRNRGNRDIAPDDFAGPIAVRISQGEVLDASVIGGEPHGIKASFAKSAKDGEASRVPGSGVTEV